MWIIDKDLVSDGEAKGICSADYKKGSQLPHKFSMSDDDGICYYQGRTDDDSDFGPLDDFGKSNAGCTGIKINGKAL